MRQQTTYKAIRSSAMVLALLMLSHIFILEAPLKIDGGICGLLMDVRSITSIILLWLNAARKCCADFLAMRRILRPRAVSGSIIGFPVSTFISRIFLIFIKFWALPSLFLAVLCRQ